MEFFHFRGFPLGWEGRKREKGRERESRVEGRVEVAPGA